LNRINDLRTRREDRIEGPFRTLTKPASSSTSTLSVAFAPPESRRGEGGKEGEKEGEKGKSGPSPARKGDEGRDDVPRCLPQGNTKGRNGYLTTPGGEIPRGLRSCSQFPPHQVLRAALARTVPPFSLPPPPRAIRGSEGTPRAVLPLPPRYRTQWGDRMGDI
jgi:hypothetical protein